LMISLKTKRILQDAIFQRLVEERFFLRVPCIIMTGKGFPDLASRSVNHIYVYCQFFL
jgi:DNA topoisomerase VI subunit A